MPFHLSLMQLQGYPIGKAIKFLKNLELQFQTSPDSFRRMSREKIVLYHHEHNMFYRKLLGAQDPSDWNALPVVNKGHLQAPMESLLSTPYLRRKNYVSNTSGSSGHPFFFSKDKFSHALSWANIVNLYGSVGLKPGAKEARFFGIPMNGRGHLKEKFKDIVANRIRFPVFDLRDGVLEKWLDLFKRYRFEYLNGYTSSLVYFSKYCIRQGVVLKEICPSLRVCIVTSEVCTPEDRESLNKGFGVPVINEYGASELSIIAFSRNEPEWPICEELVYVEILDSNNKPVPDGEPGRVICTSLHNLAFPLIRYEVGDVGAIRTINGRKNIVRLLGRTNDMARLPSGRVSPGLTFYYVSKAILERTGVIREFIVKQVRQDTFQFLIDAERDLTPEEVDLVRENMDLYLEPGLKLEIQRVQAIQRPRSGKIKHFYNEISANTQPT